MKTSLFYLKEHLYIIYEIDDQRSIKPKEEYFRRCSIANGLSRRCLSKVKGIIEDAVSQFEERVQKGGWIDGELNWWKLKMI